MRLGVIAVALIVSSSGCSHVSDRYHASADNVQALRSTGASNVAVGKFTAAPDVPVSEVQCAAMTIEPADGLTFPEYIRSAFVSELKMAGLYGEQANTTITGIVTKVEIDASAFYSSSTWTLSMTLQANGRTLPVSDKYDFKSLALNQTACDISSRRFGDAVQNLLSNAIQSPEFAALLKP